MKKTLTALAAFALIATAATGPASAATRAECTSAAKFMRAAITARQKNVPKANMDAIANQLDPGYKQQALEAIKRAYGSAEFLNVPASIASAMFAATCASGGSQTAEATPKEKTQ